MGDDGAGPRIISILREKYSFPAGVELADLGTPGLSLASHILGYERVIFVDTVHDHGTPGYIRVR